MTDRVHVNARIPEDIFDLHTRNVQEKHAADGLYMGLTAEMAIREYLDKDDGAELEDHLREKVEAIGSATPKQKKLVADFDSGEKKLAQWRIREELKEELKAYAKETDNTYSDVFALALREYWTNSRLNRIEQLVDRLETAIGPWEEQIEGDGVNVTVVDRRTAEIAMELDEQFTQSELEDAIAEVTSDSDYNRKRYTEKVTEYKGVERHPKVQDIFVPSEFAIELREDLGIDESSLFRRPFDDLSSEDRVRRVQAHGYKRAIESDGKAALKSSDIVQEFNGEPAQTTAYNLMGRAAGANGFKYGEWHDTKQLRITAQHVDDEDVIEIATETTETDETGEDDESDARSRLDELDRAEVVD